MRRTRKTYTKVNNYDETQNSGELEVGRKRLKQIFLQCRATKDNTKEELPSKLKSVDFPRKRYESVDINKYLDVVRTHNKPERRTVRITRRQSPPKIDFSRLMSTKTFRSIQFKQQKTNQKRHGLNKYMPKEHKTLILKRIPDQITTIIQLQQLLSKFGYSKPKICGIMKSCCNNKKDIQQLFIGLNSKHLYGFQDIYTNVKKAVLLLSEKQSYQMLIDISELRKAVEQQLLVKGSQKICEIQDSISNKILTIDTSKLKNGNYVREMLGNMDHKNIDEVYESVCKAQSHFGPYSKISKINRWFYQSLGSTEERLKRNFQQKQLKTQE